MKTYLDATQESVKQFYSDFNQKGKIVMLNLLKFKNKADYNRLDAIKPETSLTGREAYELYIHCTLPHLEKAGSRIVYWGDCNDFLIGPDSESWDAVLMVEHESVAKFMEFAQNKEYLQTAGHRKASLEDSRLLPTSQRT